MQCGVSVLGTRAEKSYLRNWIVVVQSSRCFANSSEDSLADQWADLITHFKCFSLANIRRKCDLHMKEGSKRIGYCNETRVLPWNFEVSSVSWQLDRVAILHKKLPFGICDKSRKETAVDSKLGTIWTKVEEKRSGNLRGLEWQGMRYGFFLKETRHQVLTFTYLSNNQKMLEKQD